jgi:uncharacterized protein YcfJ
MMNKKLRYMLALICIPALPVFAAQDGNNQFYEQAKVISATPQFERINTPVRECHTEYEQASESRSSGAGAVVGGVAGGLLGSTIGRGTGKIVAAAVGAGVGAVVGDRMDNQPQSATRPIERCAMVDNWQTVERGYLVTYNYNGRILSTVTDTRPGDTIAVSVSVIPASSRQVVSYSGIVNDAPPPVPDDYPTPRPYPHP